VLGEVATGVAYSIEQTVSGLTPGANYQLSFSIATESFGDGSTSGIQVSFPSGSLMGPVDFTAPPAVNTFWDTWGTFNLNVVPNATSMTIQFTDRLLSGVDVGLDNVQLTTASIPEPSTLVSGGLAVAVLGLVGLCRSRRARS
jgi:hypothetical protein